MTISNVFIDIESIPGETFYLEQAVEEVRPPGNFTKEDTIAAWHKGAGVAAKEAAAHRVGMIPAYCQIVSIAFAVDDGPVRTFYGKDEGLLLEGFWEGIAASLVNSRNPLSVRWIGHNIVGFDLPVLFFRCLMHGINDPRLPAVRDIKPWETTKVFDTLYQMAGQNPKGYGLANMCKLFGIESKFPDIDGSQVWGLWKEGYYQLVSEYNADDVELVRKLYLRIKEFYT
jgi:predicted PolB exonuclease-like 3'-5' exonuclease